MIPAPITLTDSSQYLDGHIEATAPMAGLVASTAKGFTRED